MREQFDVVIIGAGAAGMMAAVEAGRRGRSVLLLDHAAAPGEKIRISGGGRCNFTNINAGPKQFLSANPHFCKSALAGYTPRDFLDLVERHGIAWHEKTLGQLFCDNSAKDIIAMLLKEMRDAGVTLRLRQAVPSVAKAGERFEVATTDGTVQSAALVIATGGKSVPKMGATGFAYDVARQFGLAIVEPRPGLVPFTLEPSLLERLSPLSGVSVDAEVRHGKTAFREALLFTHRGLSGPAILQISSYWREGDAVTLVLEPEKDVLALLKHAKAENGRQALSTALSQVLPKRLAQHVADMNGASGNLAEFADARLRQVADAIQNWQVKPAGSEGYRTAEVTLGGIDTDALNSKTMAARTVPGLYFIGECVDVTGWLGGYNFQWAWSSGVAAGRVA